MGRRLLNRQVLWWAAILVIGFIGGYLFNRSSSGPRSIDQAATGNKSYYISFDDYYYEVPKQKAVDDRLVAGGQFLYNFNFAVKANTLDDLFNDGAIGVQSLIPLNGDNEAFERYINTVVKPAAESAFGGSSELTFGERDGNKIKTAELISKKDGQVVRRQYMVNLSQAVVIVTKDDSEAFRSIGESVGQASAKFEDYERMKLRVLAESYLFKNRMFDDIYRLAHEDLRGATSVGEINRLADRSKEIFSLEIKIAGITLNKKEMVATVHFIDAANPGKNKTVTMTFRQADDKWKLFALKFPNGTLTGSTEEEKQ